MASGVSSIARATWFSARARAVISATDGFAHSRQPDETEGAPAALRAIISLRNPRSSG